LDESYFIVQVFATKVRGSTVVYFGSATNPDHSVDSFSMRWLKEFG
jgi:hypothetical protein